MPPRSSPPLGHPDAPLKSVLGIGNFFVSKQQNEVGADMRDGGGGSIRGTVMARAVGLLGVAAIGMAVASPACAEALKIGMVKAAGLCPAFVAEEKGYFTAEGFAADLVFFEAGEPVAVATVSGDLDFGITGISAGLYSLAGQGALRFIGGSAREAPGFRGTGVVASNRAHAAGLQSFASLAGHSVALSTYGAPTHYALGLIAEKYGIDLKSIRVLALQGISNVVAAVTGGTADATIVGSTAIMPGITRGDMKLLGWIGDETPFQLVVLYVGTRMAEQEPEAVARFLRAFRRGSRDCHDAFIGTDERRRDGAGVDEILAIIAQYTAQPPDVLRHAISYIDAEARLDVKDIAHQIAWYEAQGMLKGAVDADSFIDRRFVLPLTQR